MSKLAPTLISGCTMVLKPAPETPLDAILLAELLTEAGVPAGVVNIVPAGREAGEHLVRHRGVDKVAFTGSTAAGRTIASICGEQLKRCSLELGGKSAAIILDDADLDGDDGGPQVRVAHEQRPGVRRPDPHPRIDGRSTTRSSTRWRRRCAAWPSATRPIPPPRSVRWSPSASRSGSRSTSPSARRRAPASWWAATAGRRASTRAGTCSRPCSPT